MTKIEVPGPTGIRSRCLRSPRPERSVWRPDSRGCRGLFSPGRGTPHPHLRETHGGLVALYRFAEQWCVESPDGGDPTTRSSVYHTTPELCYNRFQLKRGFRA